MCNKKSGAPIINLNTFKVIGIHIGKHKTSNFNLGMILRKPIDEFNGNKNNLKKEKSHTSINSSESSETEKTFNSSKLHDFCDNKKNEINIKIKVRAKDINKKIYFLDNTDYIEYNTNIKHNHDKLKELIQIMKK